VTDQPSGYYQPDLIERRIASGLHREVIGGYWDEIGALQIEFLKAHGLLPQHRLLDIGCGSLRLGVRAAGYLDAGHYWGTDINATLLEAGYEKEIKPAGLEARLPRSQLVADGEFAFPGIPQGFDFAIAQSVFTHLPFNHLRLCLARLAAHVRPEGTFFLSIFIVPSEALPGPVARGTDGVTTYPHRDPYHYTAADLSHAAYGLPWRLQFHREWNHPRKVHMAAFTRAAGNR
jgi:SAM-dependent methyltransferase